MKHPRRLTWRKRRESTLTVIASTSSATLTQGAGEHRLSRVHSRLGTTGAVLPLLKLQRPHAYYTT